eukprot:2385434-Pleurochrysis_carterae.AAC.3
MQRAHCFVPKGFAGCAQGPRAIRVRVSREQPSGIAREHGRLADVVEVEEEHDDALEADATSGVREGAVLERVDVVLDGSQVDAEPRAVFEEHLRVVDPLRAGRHLLAADEDVVRVGPLLVVGVGHRVEGAEARGELVDDVKVGLLEPADDGAEELLVLGRDVLVVRVRWHGGQVRLGVGDDLVHLLCTLLIARRRRRRLLLLQRCQLLRANRRPVLTQQLQRLDVREAKRRAREAQIFERVLRAHRLDLALAPRVEALEDGDEHLLKQAEDLVVRLVEGHLEVEADELGHVAVGKRPATRPSGRYSMRALLH